MVRTIEARLCRGVELNASRENVVINPPPPLSSSKDCIIARVPWRGGDSGNDPYNLIVVVFGKR